MAWHVGDRHIEDTHRDEQHPVGMVQNAPGAWHAGTRQMPPVQESPEQQSVANVQAVPAAWQVLAAVHTLLTQWEPEQQSASAAQAIPVDWQAQRPAVQPISPQQSVPVVHALLASRQHTGGMGERYVRHNWPAQHVATEVHAPPGAVHVGAVPQTPLLQVSPAQQLAVTEHDPPVV